MNITRKQFCGGLAGGSVALLLQACGGGGSSAPPAGGTASGCGASGAAIAGNHGHVLVIATADLESLSNKTYSIRGTGVASRRNQATRSRHIPAT
jgi:hypothetical protein